MRTKMVHASTYVSTCLEKKTVDKDGCWKIYSAEFKFVLLDTYKCKIKSNKDLVFCKLFQAYKVDPVRAKRLMYRFHTLEM